MPVRLVMGCACLLAVAVILGWVIPKFLIFARASASQKALHLLAGVAIYALIFGFALIPSAIFIELAQNPKTTFSDAGIAREGTLIDRPINLTWNEIDRVPCLFSRSKAINSLTIRTSDGRKIALGNSATRDLEPVHDLLEARLAKGVVRPCTTPLQR